MNRTEHISGILASAGCGSTLDVFRSQDTSAPVMVQWLWATPVGDTEIDETPALQRAHVVTESIAGAGFEATDEINDFFCLTNEIEQGTSCPFRPVSCPGVHIVAAGAGYVPNESATS